MQDARRAVKAAKKEADAAAAAAAMKQARQNVCDLTHCCQWRNLSQGSSVADPALHWCWYSWEEAHQMAWSCGGLRVQVQAAKEALGERGPVWWTDGTPDCNRRMAKNTQYADWWAEQEEASAENC